MKRVWLIIISVILLAGVCWAADKPVSQLPATENIKNEDLFLVSQYNAGNYFSRHITFANLKKKLDELYQAIGGGGGGGYTNLTQFTEQTPWRLFYSDGTGDVKELAFGGNGQYLKSNGAAVAPSWDAPAVGGDFNEAGNYTPTGDWDWSGVGLGSKWPTFNQDTTGNAATATDLKDYGNLYTGTVTGGALQKYDAATKKLTDGLKLGTLTDGKWCTYSTNNGLVCNSSEPVGGGGMVYPSAGMGMGLYANRPATCTVNTAYFATDVGNGGILYQCKAGNTWEKIFEPYTCPHQLADPEGDYHCDFSVAGVAGYGMEGAPDEPEEPEEPEPEPTGVILPWIITGG